jgi:hypothetical protein
MDIDRYPEVRLADLSRITHAYHLVQCELYFRDDDRTVFGVIRFGPASSFPGLETVTRKLLHDAAYRASFLDDESKAAWKGR